MGLLDRLAPRKGESRRSSPGTWRRVAVDDPVFATKALHKFLQTLTSRELPVLLDLGPVVGSNVSLFRRTARLQDLRRGHLRRSRSPCSRGQARSAAGVSQEALSAGSTASVDGILCWDLIDYLDRPAAQELANQLTRVLRPDGALLGFFGIGAAAGRALHEVHHRRRGEPEAPVVSRARAAVRRFC